LAAVDLGDRDSVLDRGKRGDLPIGNMSRQEYHPSLGRDRPVHMLETMRLDAPARFEDADFPQMRVFGRDAAEIVPHADDDARDLCFRQLGKGAADIAASEFGDAEPRSDITGERAA
jgi:hypothetical protein